MTIAQIEITQTLPALSCDYESLRNWALAMTEKYRDLVITESQVADIKKDMAELNKARQKLDRARIDAVKAVSEPINEFETKIKNICQIFTETYDDLAMQVRDFEQQAREKKREAVQHLIDDMLASTEIAPEIRGNIAVEVRDKWLNKTASMTAIRGDIQQAIDAQVAAEKAEAERRLLIENAVKAANERYGFDYSVARFMAPEFINLAQDAATALERIGAIFDAEAQKRANNQKTANVEATSAPAENVPVKADFESHEGQQAATADRCLSLIVYYHHEEEQKIREVLEQNQFMRIVRQLRGLGLSVDYTKENI